MQITMTIQEMLAKMNPQMLAQGLAKISSSLSPEQLAQAEAAIKAMGSDTSAALKNLDSAQLQAELQSNPALLKQLAQNPELLSKLQSIIKNK